MFIEQYGRWTKWKKYERDIWNYDLGELSLEVLIKNEATCAVFMMNGEPTSGYNHDRASSKITLDTPVTVYAIVNIQQPIHYIYISTTFTLSQDP